MVYLLQYVGECGQATTSYIRMRRSTQIQSTIGWTNRLRNQPQHKSHNVIKYGYVHIMQYIVHSGIDVVYPKKFFV